MAWRLYARRTTTGEWLHTDVPAGLDLTWQLNAPGYAAGFIPKVLDVEKAADGKPLWLERGTTLFAEQDGILEWVGLCSWQRPTVAGRELEFKGLSSAFALIGFDGRIRRWQPNAFDMAEELIDNAQAQPDGDVGFTVVRDGRPGDYPGDEEPPSPRPDKVKRRKGESKEAFAARVKARTKAQAEWDKEYGDRRPYSVAWWEAPYVLEELNELAKEIPFDWYEQHRWSDRSLLEPQHELVLASRKGIVRSDVALLEGVNIAQVLDPNTDVDRYGNHYVMLGAGEGRKMRRAEVGKKDGRVRTTRFGEAKHVHSDARLKARARDRFDRMQFSVKLDQAVVRGELGGLGVGDQIRVESQLFAGWVRVHGITRSTRSGNVTLSFTPQGGTP